MKKFLTVTAAILVLLFVSFWGYVQYQRHRSYQTRIPKNVQDMARVDVYALYQSLLGDYFKIRKKKKERFLEGIDLPANIFIYNLAGRDATTLYTTLPLSDKAALEQSLQKQSSFWQAPEVQPGGISIRQSADHSWTIAYNAAMVSIAYSARKENTTATLTDLLQQKDMVAVKDSRLASIKSINGPVVFTDGNYSGHIDFKQGKITGEVLIPAKDFSVPAVMQHRQAFDAPVLQLWYTAGTLPWLSHRNFTVDNLMLQGDSLLAAGLTGFELQVAGAVIQKDSVVNYEYNDDFERVATVAVKENKVPGIYAWLYGKGPALEQQLQRQQWLRTDSSIVNPAVFPLYRLYVSSGASALQFSTDRNAVAEKNTTTGDFFGLYINFDRMRGYEEFAALQPYIKLWKQLDAKATLGSDHIIKATAGLQLQHAETNALLQLLQL